MATTYKYHRVDTKTGSGANTQLQFTFEVKDYETLVLFFTIVEGTVFVSQTATIESSIDNTNWVQTDTKALGTGTSASSYYNETVSTINPLAFPYCRVTVPALGASKTAKVLISGKTRNTFR